ncbi:MAG TPA: mechanosensitive ion channel family protein [Polyangiaceae bacterium]|nr:mechanosensitive ion channel family protein [Polyangiaceae bacterium]
MALLAEHTTLLAAIVVVLLSLVLGLFVRRVVLFRMASVATGTPTRADDVLVASLVRPTPLWFLLLGLHGALQIAELPPSMASLLKKVLQSVLILSVTVWGAKVAPRLLQVEFPSGTGATGVVRYATRIVIVAVGGLVLLGSLGVSVTPVLTTVGIGGLAVALGLQETLSNLFAGMQITLAENIRIGDFIRLESGQEGTVDDIHWRVTRIRTGANNIVLIPNSKLAQSIITNFNRPSRDLSVSVELGVHYKSDLEKVERVTREVGRSIMQKVQGGSPDFEPVVHFTTFADSGIKLSVTLRAQQVGDSAQIKHEFIKAITRAYAAEGIPIPSPISVVNVGQQ